MIDIIDIFNKA